MSTYGQYVLTCMCDDKDCRETEVFKQSNRMMCLAEAREKGWLIKKSFKSYCPTHREENLA